MSIEIKRCLAITAIAALGAGFTGGALAAGPSAPADLTSLDTDKDGSVSKKEATKNKDLNKQFSKLDANKDHKLDSAEFAQFTAPATDAGSGSDSMSTPSGSSSTPAPSNPYDTTTPKP